MDPNTYIDKHQITHYNPKHLRRVKPGYWKTNCEYQIDLFRGNRTKSQMTRRMGISPLDKTFPQLIC